ncbi:hypothetical protein STEG23_005724, partial [Scotinomys teguina]
ARVNKIFAPLLSHGMQMKDPKGTKAVQNVSPQAPGSKRLAHAPGTGPDPTVREPPKQFKLNFTYPEGPFQDHGVSSAIGP